MNKLGMVGAGLLLFLISWRQDSLALLAFAAVMLVGTAIALQLRPSIAEIVSERRAPTLPELGALLGGIMLAYIGFGALDALLMANRTLTMPRYTRDDTPGRRINEAVSTLIVAAWTMIAIAPGLRTMLRRGSLWPVVVGMVASVPIAIGLYMIWAPFGDALRYNHSIFSDYISWAIGLPMLGLVFGPGIFLWLRAWRGAAQFEPAGVLGATIRAGAVGWAVLGAVAIFGFVTSMSGGSGNDPLTITCLILAIIAAAWLAGLWRLFGPEQCGLARAAIGWVALAAGYLLGIFLPAQTISVGSGWVQLALLLGLPVIAAAVAVAAMGVPWLLRRLIRGSEPASAFG